MLDEAAQAAVCWYGPLPNASGLVKVDRSEFAGLVEISAPCQPVLLLLTLPHGNE